ncbi:MAG: RNase adapter RapZ [Polyangiaceae bacterium]
MNESPSSERRRTHVVVVTGLSGAGRSTAMAALEDLGFYSIENAPPSVIVEAIEACEQAGVRRISLGIGNSVPAFIESTADAVAKLAPQSNRRVTTLFLDATDEVLLRRFSETRRPHPAFSREQDAAGVLEGIRIERRRLSPLRALSPLVVDTSMLTVHELRRHVFALLRPEAGAHQMVTRVVSFGFKYGLPSDADLVFDVRFLDNPHFVAELRPLTGQDRRVSDYVLQAKGAGDFVDRTAELLNTLLPRYEEEGKSYLTIAVGCTGGRHRSVALAEAIAERLRRAAADPGAPGGRVTIVHRDIERADKHIRESAP